MKTIQMYFKDYDIPKTKQVGFCARWKIEQETLVTENEFLQKYAMYFQVILKPPKTKDKTPEPPSTPPVPPSAPSEPPNAEPPNTPPKPETPRSKSEKMRVVRDLNKD